MDQLPENHLAVHQEFISGSHCISRSTQATSLRGPYRWQCEENQQECTHGCARQEGRYPAETTTSDNSTIYIAHIFDDMALVQCHMKKSFGASTFDGMALKYYQIITVPLALNGCHRVDFVFDQYFSLPIKLEGGRNDMRI